MEKTGVLLLTVIAVPTGAMSAALLALLRTVSGMEVLAQTTSLIATHRALTRLHPHLLLLDADLPGPALAACISQYHADFPELMIIALTITPAQQEIALAAGADHALLPGFSTATLRQLITEIRLV
jgi:DNA-binding NarL/FixJ family response regulator